MEDAASELSLEPGTVFWVRCVLERLKQVDSSVPSSISNSKAATKLLEPIQTADREYIAVISLTTKNEPLAVSIEAVGSTSSVSVEPGMLFRVPLLAGAAAIILAHNHPSGDPTPSSADRRFTEDVGAAAKTLGIRLIDHLIVAPGGSYYSFLDEGGLPSN